MKRVAPMRRDSIPKRRNNMQDKKDKHEITLTIGTPKGSFTAAFPKTSKVRDVIETAIKEMQLQGGVDTFELFQGDTLLAPIERPLVSFGLKDGDTLLLA